MSYCVKFGRFMKIKMNTLPNVTLKNCKRFSSTTDKSKEPEKKANPKLSLRKDILQKTPIGKLDEFEGKHPYEEKEPLPEFPDGVNPETGEIGGPKGPEPTRYGDWERKGRVSDF